jgi:4a-hydroxytetrahydrobiopterin dehydratase
MKHFLVKLCYSETMESSCDLTKKTCTPCKGGTPPLAGKALALLAQQLGNDWKVVEGHHLEKGYTFANFKQALAFTNQVGEIAEREGHHPDIMLSYGKVKIQLWTHKINGLSENDFIVAAKCDSVRKP